MSDTSTATSRLIGEIFVERGLVTAEQLEQALELQLRTGDRLGEILVAHFGVPRLELASVLAEQWAEGDPNGAAAPEPAPTGAASPSLEQVEREVEAIDRRPIGEIFVQGGFVTPEELERALVTQRETGQRLGEVLVAQGSITRLALASALAEQWAGLPRLRPPAPHAAPAEDLPAAPPAVPATPEPSVGSAGPEHVAPGPTALDPALGDELRAELDRQAWRLEAMEARTAELGGIRAEVEALAARPPADPTVAARLDDLALKLHALGDLGSLRAGLTERVDDLAVRVHELAALEGELRALRASFDDVRSLGGADPELRSRLDALAARLDASAHGPELSELEGMTRRVEAIEARLSDSSEQHKIRAAISDLQAELAALGGRDERGRLDSLADRLESIEERLPSAAVLDGLRDDVAGLLARPSADAALAQRVDELAARLGEQATLTGDVIALRGSLDALSARPSLDQEVRSRLDELAEQVRSLAERLVAAPDESLTSRLDELERRLADAAPSEDVREAFAAVREEMHEVAARIEAYPEPSGSAAELESIRSSLEELAQRPPADAEARRRLDELAEQVWSLADRPVAAPHETLAPRLDELERRLSGAATGEEVRESLAALREELRAVAGHVERLPVDEHLAGRLDAIEQRVADRGELEALRGWLAGLQSELQAVAAQGGRSDVDGLQARLDALEQRVHDTSAHDALRAELESVRAAVPSVDALRSELDSAVSRSAGDPGLGPRLDELAGRVERLAADAARNDDLAALRQAVAELELRPAADPSLPERLGELARRAETWQASADGVRELRLLVADLEARAVADPSVPQRLAAVERGLQDATAGTPWRDELGALRDAVSRLEQRPVADPALEARVGELAERMDELAVASTTREEVQSLREAVARLEHAPDPHPDLPARLGALSDRVDLLEPASSRLDELSARVEELSVRPAGDPALSGRLEDVERRLAQTHGLAAAIERLEGELGRLGHGVDEVAAAAAQGTSELEAALVDRLHEAVAGTREHAEGAAHELERRVSDLAFRLEALDDLARRADTLESGSQELRHELGELAQAAESSEASLRDAIERSAEDGRAGHERLEASLAELASLAETQQDRLRESTGELSRRIDAVVERPSVDEAARAEIEGLRTTMLELGAMLDRLSEDRAAEEWQGERIAAELGARIDDLARNVSEARLEGDEALRAELASRLEEADAAGIVQRDESRAELERVAASIGWRLDRVEEALAAEDREALREDVAGLERRLDVQDVRQQAQVRVTERALRKGLASLGERLAESETEYLKAGNALRRSIERLGSALVEADVAAAERDSEETLALHHANATSYVAFAPTADGYRLVAVDAPVPEVGGRVELPQCEGELVVARLGASPIPLDTRPCAYLERA